MQGGRMTHLQIMAGGAGHLQGQIHCTRPQPQSGRPLLVGQIHSLQGIDEASEFVQISSSLSSQDELPQ